MKEMKIRISYSRNISTKKMISLVSHIKFNEWISKFQMIENIESMISIIYYLVVEIHFCFPNLRIFIDRFLVIKLKILSKCRLIVYLIINLKLIIEIKKINGLLCMQPYVVWRVVSKFHNAIKLKQIIWL